MIDGKSVEAAAISSDGVVAKHHRRGAKRAFAGGKDWHFDRKAARLVNAVLHALREVVQMRVARRQFRPCVQDANDGTAIEQIRREALVLHPATVIDIVF